MKFEALQENFNKAVATASRFASTRSQLPILGNILLKTHKTKVYVSATNLEISVSIAIGAKIEKEGELCVPARVISEITGNLPKGTIGVEAEKEQLKLSASGFSSTVLGVIASDFPSVPNALSKEKAIVFPKSGLIEALSQVIFSSSLDETRPVLTGVLFILSKGSLSLVATDGFRLSQRKIRLASVEEGLQLILPKTILLELTRSDSEDDEISFSFNQKEKQAIFGVGETLLTSRLLEGEYPDFERIIPKTNLCQVSIDKEEFLRAVKLASVFARDSANIVKLKVLKESVRVLAESSTSGSQETSVDAVVKKSSSLPDPFEIAFNFHYLEDFLHSVKGENVEMEFSSATSAGVFRESGEENYLHLIMPVRVQG